MRIRIAAILSPLILGVPAAGQLVVDGEVADWAGTAEPAAYVGDDLVLRLDASEDVSLHGSPLPITIDLDLDGNPATGERHGEMGVDARITFSPQPEGRGVRVVTLSNDGTATPQTDVDADLAISPSYAARHVELRLSPASLARLAGVRSGPAVHGRIAAEPLIEQVAFVAERVTEPAGAMATIPSEPAGAMRVAAFNVLRASAMQNPEPFARIFRTLDADVYLLVEWDDTSEQQLADWFSEHVGGGPWQAATGPTGVAIATRLPLRKLVATEEGNPDAAKFVAAAVQTDIGPVVVASLHWKCCGSPHSREDRLRLTQAATVRDLLQQIDPQTRRQMVIGGDLNLVGTRLPLDLLLLDLDADQSDLAAVETPVLGDIAAYTWRDPNQPFAAGRLDFLIITDATLEPVHSFALDSAKLDQPPPLLTPETSAASDHLPIVVDVRPR